MSSGKRQAGPSTIRGFGLVELMVAMLVGMLAVAAITAVFWSSEGQKRTITSGADASENGLIALSTMERDLRVAGLGLVGLGCTIVAANNNVAGGVFSFNPLPATIDRDAPAAGSDTVGVTYSASAFANIPTRLAQPMAAPAAKLDVVNGDGFTRGSIILIAEAPHPCVLVQASADGTNVGPYWTIPHEALDDFPFNHPPAANFPVAGYSTAARIVNMGTMVRRQYFVQGGQLMMQDLNLPVGAAPVNPVPIADGVVAIRARYGRDTNSDGYIDLYDVTAPAEARELVAVQIAVVARSVQLEKTPVTPATLPLWNGGTVANGGALGLDETAQRYRYRVYQTTVPLRNVIWTNDP
jgi:type IV pilus assembly protein PilW